MDYYKAPWMHANNEWKKNHAKLYYTLTKIIPYNYAWIQRATWKKTNTIEVIGNLKQWDYVEVVVFFLKMYYCSFITSPATFLDTAISRLGDCNSLLISLPASSLVRPQAYHNQNHPGNHESDLFTFLLKSLQWLPISQSENKSSYNGLHDHQQPECQFSFWCHPATLASLLALKVLGMPLPQIGSFYVTQNPILSFLSYYNKANMHEPLVFSTSPKDV